MKKAGNLICLLMAALFVISCSADRYEPQYLTHTRTVAVVLPMQNGLEEHWKRSAELYLGELKKAQYGKKDRLEIKLEFYDEDTENIADLSSRLCDRDDIDAIVGGLRSSDAGIIAKECSWEKKTFFTLATTEELIRGYSEDGYLWAMTETDITQCEVLLSKAVAYGAKSVALVACSEDTYGKTYIDWFAFQAQEFGLEIKGLFTYGSSDMQLAASQAAASGADAVICAPSDFPDVGPIKKCFEGSSQIVLFSDAAYGPNVLQILGNEAEGLEGVAFTSDPESGFDVTCEVYFNDQPTLGESQFYDALLLLGYGFYYQMLHDGTTLKQALRTVVDGREPMSTGWMSDGISAVLDKLETGHSPDVSGASGSLDFDSKVYTNVLSTSYCHFKVYNGNYIILDYFSSDGSNRTYSTTASWNWKAENMQDFENGSDMEYPQLDKRWALLVAAAKGWDDYRFQADVLAMYQFLRSSGYDDEHIVLVMQDDIAYNEKNPEPGVVRVSPDGDNLYHDVSIDYRLSEITCEDIREILCGKSSERLPEVIGADEDDNVLLFWSGHGVPGYLSWGDSEQGINGGMAREMFSSAHFRKMICFVEACYSGSVASGCDGIPGLLIFTAANEYETSKADVFNSSMDVWMTNRFTLTLRDAFGKDPSISLRELYYNLFINTVGSHVMVYNNDNYGNMFSNTMQEFIGQEGS